MTVAQGGTGRSTSTTAYGLIAAGTTATGALQTLPAGATTEILVGGGAAALPVWTTATGSGAPVRATSPTLVTPNLGTPSAITLTNGTGLPQSGVTNLTTDLANKQPLDGELTALAGLTSAADALPYFTGSGTASTTSLTTFGRSLIDDADQAAARTTLGVDAAGTDNSTPVTLAGALDYLTMTGQEITRGAIDLTTDVTGALPTGNIADGAVTMAKINQAGATSGQVIKWNGSAWAPAADDSGGSSDHGALTGLSDDDHTQYALLAGRATGQTLAGGTASGDDLTLRSTTNATKGDVILNDQGGNVIVGGGATASEVRLMEPSGSGTNYTAIKAQAQTGNVTYTLPAADGSNGQVLSTNGSGTLSWATAGGGGGATYVIKTADEIVNNSTTLQDDDHLTFTCPANKKCVLGAQYFINNGNTAEFKAVVSASGATTVRGFGHGAIHDYTYTFNQDGTGSAVRTQETNGATVELGGLSLYGYVDPGASDRTVVIQWAQLTATAKNTTALSGSYLWYKVID